MCLWIVIRGNWYIGFVIGWFVLYFIWILGRISIKYRCFVLIKFWCYVGVEILSKFNIYYYESNFNFVFELKVGEVNLCW